MCGKKLVDGVYFDNITGEFSCIECGGKQFLNCETFNALNIFAIVKIKAPYVIKLYTLNPTIVNENIDKTIYPK